MSCLWLFRAHDEVIRRETSVTPQAVVTFVTPRGTFRCVRRSCPIYETETRNEGDNSIDQREVSHSRGMVRIAAIVGRPAERQAARFDSWRL